MKMGRNHRTRADSGRNDVRRKDGYFRNVKNRRSRGSAPGICWGTVLRQAWFAITTSADFKLSNGRKLRDPMKTTFLLFAWHPNMCCSHCDT